MKIGDKVKSWRHNAIMTLKSVEPDENGFVLIEYNNKIYKEDLEDLKKY